MPKCLYLQIKRYRIITVLFQSVCKYLFYVSNSIYRISWPNKKKEFVNLYFQNTYTPIGTHFAQLSCARAWEFKCILFLVKNTLFIFFHLFKSFTPRNTGLDKISLILVVIVIANVICIFWDLSKQWRCLYKIIYVKTYWFCRRNP